MILLEPGLTPFASLLVSALTALTSALGPLATTDVPPLTVLAPPSAVHAPGSPGAFAPLPLPTAADTPDAAVGAVGETSPWRAPLDGPLLVTDPFDPPAHDWLPGHRGVDLLAFAGDVVRTAGAGVVVFAGPVGGRGVVTVLHDDGRTTTYEPVEPEVGVGDVVEPGQVIGHLHAGAGHCGELPSCLHWGLRDGETYLDPMTLLGLGRPSLLPLLP